MYKVKLNTNISIKDEQTKKDILITKGVFSNKISEETFNYINKNYHNDILEVKMVNENGVEIDPMHSDDLPKNKIEIIEKKSPIEKIDSVVSIEAIEEFNISIEDIDEIIRNDVDRIFINIDDNIKPTNTVKQIKVKTNKVKDKKQNEKLQKEQDNTVEKEDIDIDSVLNFFVGTD